MLGCIAIGIGEVKNNNLASIKSKALLASEFSHFLNLLSWECGKGYKGDMLITLAPSPGTKNLTDEEKSVLCDVFRQYGWKEARFLSDCCFQLKP